MNATPQPQLYSGFVHRQLLVEGQLLDLWEDPTCDFGWDCNRIQQFMLHRQWVFSFNAIILHTLLSIGDPRQHS